MKKIKYLALSWCLGLTLQFFFSCTNEDNTFINNITGLETSADLLKLVDDGTNIAGELSITSDIPDVKLVWNTNEACNLDTTLSSITLKNGRYTLPIKWQKSISDGKFAPEGIAYKAGVQIIAGEYSKYVPLIWAEKVDTAKVMEAIPTTRTAESIMPRVVQIELTPITAYMNEQIGVSVHVGLKNAEFVVFDWSEFNSDINIDMSLLPNYITSSQFINFKWTSNGAPSYGFAVNYYAQTEGMTQPGIVTFIPSTPSITLSFKASNLPSGNIPFVGGLYTFTFEGNYTGAVQVRCLINGSVVNTGNAVMNKQPHVTVPRNNTLNTRNVTFQYKRADGNWENLPTSENRIQKRGIENYIEVSGIAWAPGNLIKTGNVYTFHKNQQDCSGVWNGGDYFCYNTLDPNLLSTSNTTWNPANDPCRQVAPIGTWRTPTCKEMETLIGTTKRYGKLGNRNGWFFGDDSRLFLPIAGKRWPNKKIIDKIGILSGYRTADSGSSLVYELDIFTDVVIMDYNDPGFGGFIRCVSAD